MLVFGEISGSATLSIVSNPARMNPVLTRGAFTGAHHFQRASIGYCIARWKTARKGLRKSRVSYCCRGNPGELEILFLVADYFENHLDTLSFGVECS